MAYEKKETASAASAEIAQKRLSDAEWKRREVERLEKFVDYKTALRLAERNLANRDAVDVMLKD